MAMHRCIVWGCAGLFVLGFADPSIAAFERLPSGPEAAASGEIRTVAGDPVFGNPAALAASRTFHASIWGAHPFGLREIQESQAALWLETARAGAGAGFRQLGSAFYFERELRISSFVALGGVPGRERLLSAGVSGRLLLVGGENFDLRTGYGADLGLRVALDQETTLGVHLESLAGRFPGGVGRLPSRSSLGISRSLPARIDLLLEIARRAGREPSVAAGFNWIPHELVILRAGFRDDPPQLSWGMSVPISSFLVSFSATETDPLGRTLRVGLLWSRFSQANS